MKCKEIQDLILTDYADNELSDEHRLMIEGHLMQCQDCLNALRSVRSLNDAFLNGGVLPLDKEKIWQNISAQIDEEASRSVIFTPDRAGADLRSRLIRLFRPALAFGVLASLILAVTVYTLPAKKQIAQNPPEEEQYLVYLADEIVFADQTVEFDEDLGTDLEAYFL